MIIRKRWTSRKRLARHADIPASFYQLRVPFYTIDWLRGDLSVPGPQTETDWDTLFSVIREHEISQLTASEINDAALARLPNLPQITRLHIAGSRGVTDQGIMHLARMPQLQDLEIRGQGSPITASGLEFLRHLPQLRRFHASWTPGLSDHGLVGLARCDDLEDVNLLGTQTGDRALQALAGKRNLRRFRSGSGVTDFGLAILKQFPIFKTWQGGEIKYRLMDADADPNYLLIDGPFTDAGLARLVALDGLFALSLFRHTPAFTSAGLAALKQLSNLGFLGCQDDHCDDEAMNQIAAIPRLRMLMGQGAVANDLGFEALSRSQSIEYIWYRESPNLTGRGFAALGTMPSLRGLAISCKNLRDESLSKLAEFPALRELMPMDIDDAGFRHLGKCEKLEALWCMYCRNTGDEATNHIRGLSRLKTYYAGKTNITDRSAEILGRITSLERIEFGNALGSQTQAWSIWLACHASGRSVSIVCQMSHGRRRPFSRNMYG